MSLTVGASCEGEVTVQALVWAGSTMCTYMTYQRTLISAGVHAQITLVGSVTLVGSYMTWKNRHVNV